VEEAEVMLLQAQEEIVVDLEEVVDH